MDVVAADNSWDVLDIFLDVVDIDMVWCCLEKDLCSRFCQGDSGFQDDESDKKGHCWICVESAGPVGEPDEKGRDNDSNVAKGISHNVENHGVHTHIGMVVAMRTSLGRFLWLVVIMTNVPRIMSSLMSMVVVIVIFVMDVLGTVSIRFDI